MSEPSKPTSQETKDTTPKSEDKPSEQDRLDLSNQEHRHDLVQYVRGRIGAKYGSEYTKRCAATAAYTLNALRQLGTYSYRIAAGRVEETEEARAATGDAPRTRYTGEYTGTGKSSYHVWLVNNAGNKIDCSDLPIDYGRYSLCEPHELVPELDYIEIGDTTRRVQDEINATYRLAEPTQSEM
jgi:hypothetical protein